MAAWTCPPFWAWPSLELDLPDGNCKVQEVVPGPFCSPRLPILETGRHGIPDPFGGVLGPKVEVLGPDGPCYIHCHLTEALWNEWRLSLVQGIPDPFRPRPKCVCIKGRRRIRPRICARRYKHRVIEKLNQLDGTKQVKEKALDKLDQLTGTQQLKDQVVDKLGQLKGAKKVKDQVEDKLARLEGTKQVKDRVVRRVDQLKGTHQLKGQVIDKLGQLDKARGVKGQVLDKLGQLDKAREVKGQVLDKLGQLEQTKRVKSQTGQFKARVSDKLSQLDKLGEDQIRSALKGASAPKQMRKVVDEDKEMEAEEPRSARFKRRLMNDPGTDPQSARSPSKVRSGHVTEGTEKMGPIGLGPCLKGPYYLVPAQDLVLDKGRGWQWAQNDEAQINKVQKDEGCVEQVQKDKGPKCKPQKGKGQKCKAQKGKCQNLYSRAKRRICCCFQPRQDRRTKDQCPGLGESVGVVCCRCDCPYLKVKGQGRNVRGQRAKVKVESARDESRTSGTRGPGTRGDRRSKGKSLRFASLDGGSRSGHGQGEERSRTFVSQEDPEGEDCVFQCKGDPRELPRCNGDAGGTIRCRKVPGGFLSCKRFPEEAPRESAGCTEGSGEFLRCRKVPGGFLACKKVPGETPRGFLQCKEATRGCPRRRARKFDSDSGERADVSDSSEDFSLIGNNNNRDNDNNRRNNDNNCNNYSNNKSSDCSRNSNNNSRKSQNSGSSNKNENNNNNSITSNNNDNRIKDSSISSSSKRKSGGSDKSINSNNNSDKSKISSTRKNNNNSKYNRPRIYASQSEKEDGGLCLEAGFSPIKNNNNGSSWFKPNQNGQKILEETFLSERQDSSSECEFLCSISDESEMEVLQSQNGRLMATHQDEKPVVPISERQPTRINRASLKDEAKDPFDSKDKAEAPFGSMGKAERPLSPKAKAKGLLIPRDDGKDRSLKKDKAKGPFGLKGEAKGHSVPKDEGRAWKRQGSSRSKGTDTSGIRFTPGPCLGLRIGNFTEENYLDEFLDRNRRNNNNNSNRNNKSSSINSSDSPCYPARERRRNWQRASTT